MRLVTVTMIALGVFAIGASGAQAQRKCGFGMWKFEERCRHGPLICERVRMDTYGSATKQWKCWHRKGVRWRPNKKAKMKRYHWF